MKRGGILNRHLSTLVASLGHLDEIVVADAGLPVPVGVGVIDLAVTFGVPSFFDVVKALQSELVIEKAIHADEISDELRNEMARTIASWNCGNEKSAVLGSMSHVEFKRRTQRAKAIIRTGECTPYCNFIFVSGVSF